MDKKNTRILDLEAKGCFEFFWKEVNDDESSPGYGLIRDKTGKGSEHVASIASVGFGLPAIVIGIERGWITYNEGYKRVKGTLATFLNEVEHYKGFFYHFINMKTGKKNETFYDCPSIIDTTLFLNGVVVVAEYFGGDIAVLFEELYQRIDWSLYYDEENNWFYMGYRPESGGFGSWNMYAEQMTQYILGIGSPTHPVPRKIYDGFARKLGKYRDYEFYNSPGGALFTHQFSHAFFDFRDKVDQDGIDWFQNSVKATLASRQYSIDNPLGLKTLNENAWGLTACDGPTGYVVPGIPPYWPKVNPKIDGTLAPAGAAGSIVFTPEETLAALNYYYDEFPKLWGPYGFQDAYNLDQSSEWFSDCVIGIDKGITLLMIENDQTGLIWDLYMKNEYVKKASELIGFKKKVGS